MKIDKRNMNKRTPFFEMAVSKSVLQIRAYLQCNLNHNIILLLYTLLPKCYYLVHLSSIITGSDCTFFYSQKILLLSRHRIFYRCANCKVKLRESFFCTKNLTLMRVQIPNFLHYGAKFTAAHSTLARISSSQFGSIS